jgi:hypothetical protein
MKNETNEGRRRPRGVGSDSPCMGLPRRVSRETRDVTRCRAISPLRLIRLEG